jgi:hypothetical protein
MDIDGGGTVSAEELIEFISSTEENPILQEFQEALIKNLKKKVFLH